MAKLVGKTAKQILYLINDYIYRDRDTGGECTLFWDNSGKITADYANGETEVYNDIVGPSKFIAVRLKTKREKELGLLPLTMPRTDEDVKEISKLEAEITSGQVNFPMKSFKDPSPDIILDEKHKT